MRNSLRSTIQTTKNVLVQVSNSFNSADTIKKIDQFIKAKTFLIEKKKILLIFVCFNN